jgi:hypothetical protein
VKHGPLPDVNTKNRPTNLLCRTNRFVHLNRKHVTLHPNGTHHGVLLNWCTGSCFLHDLSIHPFIRNVGPVHRHSNNVRSVACLRASNLLLGDVSRERCGRMCHQGSVNSTATFTNLESIPERHFTTTRMHSSRCHSCSFAYTWHKSPRTLNKPEAQRQHLGPRRHLSICAI